ncbi:filamentous hemagglutinin N-terminal domain-containing protein [Lysobacter pythonis]|uniref:Filamentous hemagglutinin N-terminal domain-containing protein n=1 Tax=Solilutibacter pythonis TaxID=2483112 RepID=A0A3M2HTU9_9GAMM|nr:filamentous hemagglutinin N-terminal domain-containing protein [Lysobacter pythonis]RMH90829.1 filamentous hemagglutinin N-terminal domain-containing protein [Lysobacter pythonis]
MDMKKFVRKNTCRQGFRTARQLPLMGALAVLCFLSGGPLNVFAQQAPVNLNITIPVRDGRTQVEEASNGTPVVQIATPNAAGVSHNVYDQYDVGPRGHVLNNSKDNVRTQLGGWIQGNANLMSSPSDSLILNEVTSTNPSVLNGYIEVAGRKADVIIANPNGITCGGCGFINTAKAGLTTGRPVFGGDGSLSAFKVEGGSISIAGRGMDVSQLDRVDLISHAVRINAGLWA